MPMFKVLDPKYDYEQITEDDVWTYGAIEASGVVKVTQEIYEEKIMNNKKGDKPWWVVIIVPGTKTKFWHSTYVMKTLYFLNRDYPEEANYGFIDTNDEYLREVFDNSGIPQSMYIKDG